LRLLIFFRKGPVVCRGLDLDLSEKVAQKMTLTRKRRRHAHYVSPSTADATATAYIHIYDAVVTRSHFGNAKPQFHMNC